MAYSQEEDRFSLSSHGDRDIDSICSEENIHESLMFTRRYPSPTRTVPETPFLIEPRVFRERSFDSDSKSYRECDVPTHDTGYLSLKEPSKPKVSFSDERFPLLSFSREEFVKPQFRNVQDNTNEVSDSVPIREMYTQKVMPPEPFEYRDTSVCSKVFDTEVIKEAPYFKPKSTSSHTISTPSFTRSVLIPRDNEARGTSNVPVVSTPTYKEHFPSSSLRYKTYPEPQITHTRPTYSLDSNQRETIEESVYTLPKARPPYPLDPYPIGRFSNFEHIPQSNAFVHSDRDPIRVPIYMPGSLNSHSVRQTGTLFGNSRQDRDNFSNPRFSVSSHLTQNVPTQAMITNPLLGQNWIGHSGQATSNLTQTNHYPMNSAFGNSTQTNHYPMNLAMSNPVQASHYPMNLAMSNPVQASHYQMNTAINNPIQQTMNNPMGTNMNSNGTSFPKSPV